MSKTMVTDFTVAKSSLHCGNETGVFSRIDEELRDFDKIAVNSGI